VGPAGGCGCTGALPGAAAALPGAAGGRSFVVVAVPGEPEMVVAPKSVLCAVLGEKLGEAVPP
jgi:hypothetical protein